MVQNILGGNQYTGARSTVMKKVLRLEKIGKYMFCLDAVINGVIIWNNASENNYELIFQSSANIVFGYIFYLWWTSRNDCGNNVLFYDFCSSWIYILSDNKNRLSVHLIILMLNHNIYMAA